jgi:hypothetical protein
MLLYILYNADLLEITEDELKEDALGYVDDIALVATGDDFEETTQQLKQMMTREGGGLQWSREHNSRFEVSKSAIIHFTRKTIPDPHVEHGRVPMERPKLVLEGQEVKETTCYKYLGVQMDSPSQLCWKEQAQRATANATKWILQYRQLTRPSTGVKSKLMRHLYIAVALPNMIYGFFDVWYTPPTKPVRYTKNTGSVGILRNLQKTQRLATTAITGMLRSLPTDLLDAHAGLFPMELALMKACHRAMTCMLTLPNSHPLHSIITSSKRHTPDKHPSPINQLLSIFKLSRTNVETIDPTKRAKVETLKLKTSDRKSGPVRLFGPWAP